MINCVWLKITKYGARLEAWLGEISFATLAPIWLPHWPAWMWTISLMTTRIDDYTETIALLPSDGTSRLELNFHTWIARTFILKPDAIERKIWNDSSQLETMESYFRNRFMSIRRWVHSCCYNFMSTSEFVTFCSRSRALPFIEITTKNCFPFPLKCEAHK